MSLPQTVLKTESKVSDVTCYVEESYPNMPDEVAFDGTHPNNEIADDMFETESHDVKDVLFTINVDNNEMSVCDTLGETQKKKVTLSNHQNVDSESSKNGNIPKSKDKHLQNECKKLKHKELKKSQPMASNDFNKKMLGLQKEKKMHHRKMKRALEFNGDYNFLMSLLPYLEKLPPTQKYNCRARINEIISQELENNSDE